MIPYKDPHLARAYRDGLSFGWVLGVEHALVALVLVVSFARPLPEPAGGLASACAVSHLGRPCPWGVCSTIDGRTAEIMAKEVSGIDSVITADDRRKSAESVLSDHVRELQRRRDEVVDENARLKAALGAPLREPFRHPHERVPEKPAAGRAVDAETPETLVALSAVTRSDLNELRRVLANVIDCGNDMASFLTPITGEVRTWRKVTEQARGNLIPVAARRETLLEIEVEMLAAQVRHVTSQRDSALKVSGERITRITHITEVQDAALKWVEILAQQLPAGPLQSRALAWAKDQRDDEEIPF